MLRNGTSSAIVIIFDGGRHVGEQTKECLVLNNRTCHSKQRIHIPVSISGLVVEYIVAIDVTRVRFPADA